MREKRKDSTMLHTICPANTLLYKFQVGIGKAGVLLTPSLFSIPYSTFPANQGLAVTMEI